MQRVIIPVYVDAIQHAAITAAGYLVGVVFMAGIAILVAGAFWAGAIGGTKLYFWWKERRACK